MAEEIDYAARVQRGIALMDEKWPDWATEIDLIELDIASGSCCMTAQYAHARGAAAAVHPDPWVAGQYLLNLTEEAYADHGFVADDDDDEKGIAYDTLNDLWRAEIERRRAQGQDAPAEPEAGA